jgi:Ca-activated chloride channel family protein
VFFHLQHDRDAADLAPIGDDDLSALYWRESTWLWAILLPVVLPLLTAMGQRRKLSTIIDAALLPWVQEKSSAQTRRPQRLLLLLAWLLFITALAGPRTLQWVPPELRAATSHVVAIIDFSASMRADDMRPTRRDAAITLLDGILARSSENTDIGLVVFAGHGHLLLPPTRDHELLKTLASRLGALRTPTLGNNLAAALEIAADTLNEKTGYRAILLFSDGDMEKTAVASAQTIVEKKLRPENIHLFTIGFGGTEKVALPASLATEVLQENRTVLTRQEKTTLQQLASSGNGDYMAANQLANASLAEIVKLPLPRLDTKDQGNVLWTEWFSLPLIVGLGLLVAAVVRPATIPSSVVVLLFLLSIQARDANATPAPEVLLKNGEFAAARDIFSRQKGYHARFGEGIACYRLEAWSCARQAFSRAAWLAHNDHDRGRAAFNLGNSHFQLGEFEEAAVLFDEANKLGVDPAATQRNLEFADELADALQKYRIHLEMVKKKADWMANARDIPEGLLERLTEGIWLKLEKSRPGIIRQLGREKLNQLIQQGVARALGIAPSTTRKTIAWSGNSASLPPENSIGLFNRLLPLEAGLGAIPKIPYRLEGQRPW